MQNGKFGKLMYYGDIYKGKRVLLTGDTGFKGSWMSIWLKELGAEVFGYSLPPGSSHDNFVSCNLGEKINHLDGDVRELEKLKLYFKDVNPDIAFHFAAQPLVLLSYSDPVNTFETNLMGVVNFFESVRNTQSVKAAINITSDKCYENNEWVWGYRENDPKGGKDPYSASKGCAELITNAYMHSYFGNSECKIASARAGNVIGGGDWAMDRIIPDYFRAAQSGEKLVLRNPYSTRPWQHVLEPLSGYLALGAELLTNGYSLSGGWNFGPEDSANYSVKDLIDTIISIDGTGGYEVAETSNKVHEALFLKLDISKAVNQLKWRPTLSFSETIAFTVKGYQDELTDMCMYMSRVDQIAEYSEKAARKKIRWAM